MVLQMFKNLRKALMPSPVAFSAKSDLERMISAQMKDALPDAEAYRVSRDSSDPKAE
ncbi:hypothetical protein [Phyllobacterium sp. SB3]|uniref:hypothetical protein n=1 Tax=Phyllobacterium sp. SB3 TaxID=3156073 RepID=UPI0032AF74BA